MGSELSLTLYEAADTQDGIVRLDPMDMKMLGVGRGDIIVIEGSRRTYVQVQPSYMEDRNQNLARVSTITAQNTGLKSGQSLKLFPEKLKPPRAELVVMEAEDDLDRLHVQAREKQLTHFWWGQAAVQEDYLRVPTLDRYNLRVKIVSTQPAGLVRIGPGTKFAVATRSNETDLPKLAGLRELYRTCQGLSSAHFSKEKPSSAQKILLRGPEGCGKASLVRRLAKDLDVPLRVFDAHSLIDQWVARESSEIEVALSDLARRGPSIIMFDHMDALTITPGTPSSIAIAMRSITAQICSMLDEIPTQPDIFAFGVATGDLDTRFDGVQKFDLVLPVDAPNRWGRHEILLLGASSIPMAEGVDLEALSTMAAGATGRDLRNLIRTAHLMAQGTKVVEQDLYVAFRSMTLSASQEVRCDIPTTTWEEVVGFEDIKQMLCDTLSWALQLYDKFAAVGVDPPRSVLLSGAQGTGKTCLVRSLASYMPVNFIEIDCSVLASRTPEAAATYLQEAFLLARRKAPCLVFFDEIDVLFEGEETDSDPSPHYHPIVAQLMADLDSLALFPGVVVVAATNRPDRLTAEVLRPGRFDFAVALPLPDTEARKKILQMHARRLPLSSDIDFDKLAADTHGLSPSDIANLCNRVGMMALRNSLASAGSKLVPPVVNAALFAQALRGRKPSASSSVLSAL